MAVPVLEHRAPCRLRLQVSQNQPLDKGTAVSHSVGPAPLHFRSGEAGAKLAQGGPSDLERNTGPGPAPSHWRARWPCDSDTLPQLTDRGVHSRASQLKGMGGP